MGFLRMTHSFRPWTLIGWNVDAATASDAGGGGGSEFADIDVDAAAGVDDAGTTNCRGVAFGVCGAGYDFGTILFAHSVESAL